MKYLKVLTIVGCLSFTGCLSNYDVIQHQKIQNLKQLSQQLKQQQQSAKERYIQYKAKGNTTGMLQTGKIIGISKGSTKIIDDATDNAKPVGKFIEDKGKEFLEPVTPFLGGYGQLLEGALGLATLIGGAFGVKKGHQVVTRRGRIKQAVLAVKSSPIGKQGQFNPCDPEIVAAMKLYLNDNDFKVWKESHGC